MSRKVLQCEAVFDIETEDWTTFVMGGIRTKEGTEIYNDEDQLLEALLSIKGRVWAHNLGRFDGLWLLDRLYAERARVEVVNAAARVVSARVDETEFCDSLALVPMSLAEWTGEKEATGLPCRCPPNCGCSKGCLAGDGCGGYCAISRRMGHAQKAILRRYLVNDLEILWKSLGALESFASEHDLDLGLTIGGSSWSTVERKLNIPRANWRGTTRQGWKGVTYEGIRDGYFGGRCQVFQPRLDRGWLADVNSMYPYQLATVPMPIGEPRDSYQPGADYQKGRPGIFLADVEVREMFVPPLPMRVRDRQGTDRVAYPVGKFRGTWTGLELRWAESLGVRVTPLRAIVWPDEEVLFDGWMKKLFALRTAAGKKSWLGKWLKLFANSLTGKFAMRSARSRYLFHPDESNLKPWDAKRCAKFCKSKACRGKCGASVECSPGIWKAETYFVNPCAHVEFAAHLTAGARVTIGRHLVKTKAAYTDTDSLFAGIRPAGLGTKLGELEDKGPIRNFHALAPKVYSYEEYVGPDFRGEPDWSNDAHWVPIYAAKGISNPESRWARIAAGETVESGRIRGFVTGAKRGDFFKRDQLKRTVKLAVAREGAYGDREISKDGKTRARDIGEFREVRT